MENFISKIIVNKVRHLHDIEIKLSQDERKHLILTGRNGSGKTSVLIAIRAFLRIFENTSYYHILKYPQDISCWQTQINELENNSTFSIEQKISSRNKLQQNINSLTNILEEYDNGLKVYFNFQSDTDTYEKYQKGDFILAYFDAKRISKIEIPKSVEKVKLQEKYSIGNSPGNLFVKYLVDLKAQQAFARNENEMIEVEKIEIWFQNFEKSLKNLFEDENLKLNFDYKNYRFEINQTGKEPFGFEVLSDGYSALLNIIMDLILRMEKKQSGKYDIEGIVLIDEIETHLHIELQKKILPFLTAFFPKIQFIVTTHSPFVLNSINDTVIFDLEKLIKVEDLSGYSYEGIVEGFFDSDMYSDEIKKKISRYEELVFCKTKSEAEKQEEIDLRLYLKGLPHDLSKELVVKFGEIELKRKGANCD